MTRATYLTRDNANSEVVVGYFEAVNARDFAAVMDSYADGVVLVTHGGLTAEETVTGKQAAGEWFEDWFRQFDRDYRFEIEESLGRGEHVFVVATQHGRGRHSGARVEKQVSHVYAVRDGKIRRLELWVDRDPALAAFAAPVTGRPT